MDEKKVYQNLIRNIRTYFNQHKHKKAVIGLSGGIDSSLSCKLVVDALGPENVTGLLMPEEGLTNVQNIRDAEKLCHLLKATHHIQPINPFLKAFTTVAWKSSPLALANTKSRIRAVLLYNYANSTNSLVIGTSNKSELMLGYFTKYGDGAVDLEVIGSLYKTEVIALATYLKLPPPIITKVPTAELFPGQIDKDDLKAEYAVIDKILQLIEEGKQTKAIIAVGFAQTLVEHVVGLIQKNKHKLVPPPTIMY
ncbi:NAD+ synthase [Candidatus Woesearchaeota archaeon]|nr:NAD+ synthase [Candidatus Woesearchaeota archaeon]